MRYRFRLSHRQYKPGDFVPEGFDAGIVATLLQVHKIEPVPDAPPDAKSIDFPPADKMLRPAKLKRKSCPTCGGTACVPIVGHEQLAAKGITKPCPTCDGGTRKVGA